MEKYNYHIFPPYIDAYIQCFNSKDARTLLEIKELAEIHAVDWGDEIEERCNERGVSFPEYDGKKVVCCVYTYNGYEPERSYLIVTDGTTSEKYWFDNLEFIEGNVANTWNVT